jgi:hypothetical protein
MSDPETLFAFVIIVTALAVAILTPQLSREADLWMVEIFAMIIGAVIGSIGFVVFTTNWSSANAWRSGVFIVIGGLITCYMMKRLFTHGRPPLT